MHFLTADYVFPIHEAPVAGGILVLQDDGTLADMIDPLTLDYDIPTLEKHAGFLCPGFVNTHCHLEYSWAKGLISEGRGLDHFLKSLDTRRRQVQPDEVEAAIQREADAMLKSGIVAVGDIANTMATLNYKESSPILFYTFAEIFGSEPTRASAAFERVSGIFDSFRKLMRNNRVTITPHAPYSLSPELFRLVGVHMNSSGSLMAIHHQESEDENQYFMDGSGLIAHRRSLFNPGIAPFLGTGKRPLESIASHFNKDQHLLLVHNTVSREQDVAFAEGYFRQLNWCFCPNANLFIENKIPDIDLFRRHGCRITLGTDSLASNHSLSMLDEIKTLLRYLPEIPFSEMLGWATSGGAKVLGFDQLGTFEKGKQPGVVLIENVDIENLTLYSSSWSRLLMHGYDSLYQ